MLWTTNKNNEYDASTKIKYIDMYIPELKTFEYGTVISAICKDIGPISGFPYVCVYYNSNSRYGIATFNIDVNTDNISLAKYDVRIFYI